MTATRYVEGDEIRLTRPEGAANLRVELLGELSIISSRIRRLFPLSDPKEFFSIQDGAGKEVAILRTADRLDQTSRTLLEEDLDRRYFTPVISQVVGLKQDAGMWKFDVKTQRGNVEFYVRNWRDSAFEIAPGRWQIYSVDGQRYEIFDLEKLDGKSYSMLEQLF